MFRDAAIDAAKSLHSIQPIEAFDTVEALDALKIALDSAVGLLMSVRLVAMLSQVAVTMCSTMLLVSTAVESLALSVSAMGRNGAIADLLRGSIGYLMVAVRWLLCMAVGWLLCVLIAGGDSSC